jgi:hypothetical protein
LTARTRCGCSPCPAQIRRTEDGLIPTALAIAGAVQWVASCNDAWLVSITTRSNGHGRQRRECARAGSCRGSNPATPSRMKRSCQRHTTVLSLPTVRVMALVPAACAVSSTIRARQTCFCGLRSRTIASNRTRSAGVTMMDIPLRIPQDHTQNRAAWNSNGASPINTPINTGDYRAIVNETSKPRR